MNKSYELILVRHGMSEWNEKNLFTGWVDVDLTAQGVKEAGRAGELIKESGLKPDVLHTSVLKRAIRTAQLALDKADLMWLPVQRSWRLNERHYGALQGLNKTETLKKYGEEQFMLWRRSFDVPPPEIDPNNKFAQNQDPRYKDLPPEAIPLTECLKDVIVRMIPYWYDNVVPQLLQGKQVLIVAHGNSLRALVKHLDQISDSDIASLNIPTGIPLHYQLDKDFKPINPGGTYLDPDAAKAAIEKVANQGRK
jgi:2,3-bisphosphoglycerate-dependent phosphoglycerate mutase